MGKSTFGLQLVAELSEISANQAPPVSSKLNLISALVNEGN